MKAKRVSPGAKHLVDACLACRVFQATFIPGQSTNTAQRCLARWPRYLLSVNGQEGTELAHRGHVELVGLGDAPMVLISLDEADEALALEGRVFAEASAEAHARLCAHLERHAVERDFVLAFVRLPAGTPVLATIRDGQPELLTPIVIQPEVPQRRVYRVASRLRTITAVNEGRQRNSNNRRTSEDYDDLGL